MNRNHRKNPMGTIGMDYTKKPVIIETSLPQQMSTPIPQSPHHATSMPSYSYPSSYKKIPKSKRFQKD